MFLLEHLEGKLRKWVLETWNSVPETRRQTIIMLNHKPLIRIWQAKSQNLYLRAEIERR